MNKKSNAKVSFARLKSLNQCYFHFLSSRFVNLPNSLYKLFEYVCMTLIVYFKFKFKHNPIRQLCQGQRVKTSRWSIPNGINSLSVVLTTRLFTVIEGNIRPTFAIFNSSKSLFIVATVISPTRGERLPGVKHFLIRRRTFDSHHWTWLEVTDRLPAA